MLSHLSGPGIRPLLGHFVCDDGDVSPLLIQYHGELSVELLDFQMDPVLAFKHLADLPVIHALIQILD